MNLEEEIKKIIIAAAELEMSFQDIDSNAQLFGDDGLGLDSIDALEIGIALKKRFGVGFSDAETENKKHFYSVASLAAFIASQKHIEGEQ